MLYFALATLTISLIELIIRRKENEILENDLKDHIESSGRTILKYVKELTQEKKDHTKTKEWKTKYENLWNEEKKENKTLKEQNTELQEFVVFTNKVVSESDYALKKEYKNSKVKCIGFKKVLENTIKEGHELFR